MKKGTIILLTMLAAAAVAIGFGIYVINQRINTQPIVSNTPNPTPTPEPTPPPSDTPVLSSTAGWKTYTNDKHGFTVQYPTNLQAGAVSSNSVLGTFDVPVRGLHVGPLVLVALEDKDLKKQAQEYFDSLYQAALNPPKDQTPGDGPGAVACTVDKVTNPNVVSVKSVSCNGEGGAAKYAYVSGKSYDVFIDGYSKGYDSADNGSFASDTDYATVLSTFVFTKDGTAASTNPGPVGDSTTPTDSTAAIQTFSVVADDTSATPNIISIPKGTIVEITFSVPSLNVSDGGLAFKSSVTNTGTIFSGQSKTVSFTANNSFSLTPYSPVSNTAKSYKVNVTVN